MFRQTNYTNSLQKLWPLTMKYSEYGHLESLSFSANSQTCYVWILEAIVETNQSFRDILPATHMKDKTTDWILSSVSRRQTSISVCSEIRDI